MSARALPSAAAAHPEQHAALEQHRHKQRGDVVRAQRLHQRLQAQLARRRPDRQRRARREALGAH